VSGERAVAVLELAHPHDAAWRELGLMSARLWRLLAMSLPVFALGYALGFVLSQAWIYPLVALAWLALVGRAGKQMAGFACPACGGAFFETWYFFKPLRSRCAQCGAPRGSAKDAPRAPTAARS
jgi:hypothetical protein